MTCIIFICLFSLYTIFGFALYFFQEKLLFPASHVSFSDCKKLSFAEKIGTDFRAYFIKKSEDNLIVYYHGNGGRMCDYADTATYFSMLGYSVLAVEYPGYAEEGVTPSLSSMLETVHKVNLFTKKSEFKNVVVVGQSIGVGPAAYHASLGGQELQKVILITPYKNMYEVVKSKFPYYPISLLLKHDFTPDEWLKRVNVPIHLLLAENDEVVGFSQGEALYQSIPSRNKTKVIIKGAYHNTLTSADEFFDDMKKELDIQSYAEK